MADWSCTKCNYNFEAGVHPTINCPICGTQLYYGVESKTEKLDAVLMVS